MNSVVRAAEWSVKVMDFGLSLLLFPVVFILAVGVAIHQALRSK